MHVREGRVVVLSVGDYWQLTFDLGMNLLNDDSRPFIVLLFSFFFRADFWENAELGPSFRWVMPLLLCPNMNQ